MRLFKGRQGEGSRSRALPRRVLLFACVLVVSLLLLTDFFLGSSSSWISSGNVYSFFSLHGTVSRSDDQQEQSSNRSEPRRQQDHSSVPSPSEKTLSARNSSPSNENPVSTTDANDQPPGEENNYTRSGFAVWSSSCQIPDLDPWHPTIRHLVSTTPPVDCTKGHPPISRSSLVRDPVTGDFRTALRIDPELVLNGTNGTKPRCCYQNLIRINDDHVDYSEPCRTLDIGGESVLLTGEEEEFVRVECWAGKRGEPFYTNFHASTPEKESIKKRPKAPDNSFSIFILGLDALSRLNAHRQIPLTMEYLKSELSAVEMKGFQKVGDNTFPNLAPVLSGYSEEDLPQHCWSDLSQSYDNCTWLWRSFSSVGYRTLYGEDAPWMSTFNYLKPGFTDPPTDYYARPYIKTLEHELGWNKAINCHRCVGPVSQAEAMLNWTSSFLHRFSNSPYFALTWLNSLSHDYLNSASSGDLLVRDFLQELKEGGHLDRTVVVVMGDHGLRWGEIVETYIGRIEERMPLLTISLPKELQILHPEWLSGLRYNSRRLCTHFDLHSTFMDLLPDASYHSSETGGPGLTLFAPLPVDRSCEEAGVAGQWCTCQKSEEVAVDDDEVLHVVRYVVNHLNSFYLKAYPQCAHLKLKSVSSARLRSPLDHLKGEQKSADIFDYSATFRTSPGGAVFDATVRFVPQNHTHELLGEVSRLNLYGNQSWCVVDDAKVRKYCFCKKQLKDNVV